ncbi:MAG: hypothetical protein KY475_26915, partial [Planctomycetes bacterium]|nr:hypothetical protein [Planctomycetota bacterium]
VVSANLTIDECRQMFERTLRVTPLWSDTGWKCLVIEELEALPSQTVARYLKVALEQLPPRTVVVATSNGVTGIDKALLQRFKLYFFAGGPALAETAAERLAEIWERETGGGALPPGWQAWGWRDDDFSLRLAFDQLEDSLELACV